MKVIEAEAIHCKTAEENRSIRSMLHDEGLTWRDGSSYLEFDKDESDMVLYPKRGTWERLKYCEVSFNNIIPASEFLSTPKNGDTVYGSDDNQRWTKGRYIGKDADGYHVLETECGKYESFLHIQPFKKDIDAVKKLMKKYGIKKEDL